MELADIPCAMVGREDGGSEDGRAQAGAARGIASMPH